MIDHRDAKEIEDLFVGRRIVAAETGDWKIDRYEFAPGKLTLDDGTIVYVVPVNECCAWHEITKLATCDNVISSARVEEEDFTVPGNRYDYSRERYTLFVVADAHEVGAVVVEGSEGSGYYGHGFKLSVVMPSKELS